MNVLSTQTSLSEQVIAAIQTVIGSDPVVLHEPSFNGNEWLYLKECLDSTFVSSVGKFVDRLEADLAAFTGAKYAVAVVNGTAALHIALKLAGVNFGDEVLIPALTFVATANAVTYCGASPHFVDSEERTLGIDAEKLRDYLKSSTEQHAGECVNRTTGRIIRAVVPMHTFGHPADVEGLLAVATDYNLALVEDAAESLGSYYHGQHTGTFGLMGTLSFNGNKTITTGEGGMVVTCNHSLYEKAWKYKSQGVVRGRDYWHDSIGFNYRMNNICAAIGLAQLERIEEFLEKKRLIEAWYREELAESQVVFQEEGPGVHSSFWMVSILLPHSSAVEALRRALADAEIETRPLFSPIHLMPMLDDKGPFPVAQNISARGLNLPSWPGLTRRDIASVCDTIKRFFESGKKGFSGR